MTYHAIMFYAMLAVIAVFVGLVMRYWLSGRNVTAWSRSTDGCAVFLAVLFCVPMAMIGCHESLTPSGLALLLLTMVAGAGIVLYCPFRHFGGSEWVGWIVSWGSIFYHHGNMDVDARLINNKHYVRSYRVLDLCGHNPKTQLEINVRVRLQALPETPMACCDSLMQKAKPEIQAQLNNLASSVMARHRNELRHDEEAWKVISQGLDRLGVGWLEVRLEKKEGKCRATVSFPNDQGVVKIL